MYPIYRDARIISSAGICRSINEISRVVNVPVATVWRTINEFEKKGMVFVKKEGKNAQITINSSDPAVQSIIKMAEDYQIKAMNPERIIASYFDNAGINYVFIGPTREKYAGGQMTNQVWMAVTREKDAKIARNIIKANEFTPVSSVSEAVGDATQKIVVKIVIMEDIKAIKTGAYRVATEETNQKAMRKA